MQGRNTDHGVLSGYARVSVYQLGISNAECLRYGPALCELPTLTCLCLVCVGFSLGCVTISCCLSWNAVFDGKLNLGKILWCLLEDTYKL